MWIKGRPSSNWVRVLPFPEEAHACLHRGARVHRGRTGEAEAQTRVENAATVRWIDLLRFPAVWGMELGNFCVAFVIYWFVTLFPTTWSTAATSLALSESSARSQLG